MQVLYERCCGLDVHKKTVVACALTPGPEGQPEAELRTLREEVAAQQKIEEQTVVAPNVMAELNARREQLRLALAGEQSQAGAEAARLEEKRGRLRDIEAMQEELAELARVYDGRCSPAQTAPAAPDFDLIASYFADVVVPEDRQSGGAR